MSQLDSIEDVVVSHGSDDENDCLDQSIDSSITLEIEQKKEIPSNYECPELIRDGKWYPSGFPTYFCYVC
jgi:hypothetical protein